MAKMTYGQLHGVITNDNTNIDNMIRGFINESANASVVAIYDDSLVLLDTIKEDFYSCKYHFNPDNLSVILEDFDKIELSEDNTEDFKVAVKDYLISENEDASSLLNSYLKTFNKSKLAVDSVIAESVADKDYSNVADFEELSFINEEFDELKAMPFFEDYTERLITHPLNHVLFLDWDNPVAFSLLEATEDKEYLNSNSKKKAKKLCASKDFKKKICKCCKEFSEDVELGGEMLMELFADNLSLFSLTETELKEAVAKAVMLDPELNGNYKQIAEAVAHFIKNDEGMAMLAEAIDIDDDGDEDEKKDDKPEEEKKDGEVPEDDKSEDKEDKKDDDKATELTAEDKEALKKALKTVLDKATDDKIKDMAQNLLDKVEDMIETDATKVTDVKECVEFLNI